MNKTGNVAVVGLGVVTGLGIGAFVGENITGGGLDAVTRLRADIAACAGRLGMGETSFPTPELPGECASNKGAFDTTITIRTQGGSPAGKSERTEVLSVPSKKVFEERAEKTIPTENSQRIIDIAMTTYGGLVGLFGGTTAIAISRRKQTSRG